MKESYGPDLDADRREWLGQLAGIGVDGLMEIYEDDDDGFWGDILSCQPTGYCLDGLFGKITYVTIYDSAWHPI